MLETAPVRPALLNALPRVFHPTSEDESSRPLDALLALMEDTFSNIHHQLDDLETYLDWTSAPQDPSQDFLTWLGRWVGMSLWTDWPETKKRFVVSQAVALYEYRGTRLGLEYLVSLFLGLEVRVAEWDWPEGLVLGGTSTVGLDGPLMDQPDSKRRFVVYWDVDQEHMEFNTVRMLHCVIQAEKPAHTAYYIQVRSSSPGVPKDLRQFIIGESSIIGAFYIEGED